MILRWTKAVCQARTIKTFPLSEGKANDKWWERFLKGIVTCIHMWSLASGNLLLGSLNICLRTQYSCGYNYNHYAKKKKNPQPALVSEWPFKKKNTSVLGSLKNFWNTCMWDAHVHTCTHTQAQYWFLFYLHLHNNSVFTERIPGSSALVQMTFPNNI